MHGLLLTSLIVLLSLSQFALVRKAQLLIPALHIRGRRLLTKAERESARYGGTAIRRRKALLGKLLRLRSRLRRVLRHELCECRQRMDGRE